MPRIQQKTTAAGPDGIILAGASGEVSQEEADRRIAAGYAIEAPESAAMDGAPETAAKKPAKRKSRATSNK